MCFKTIGAVCAGLLAVFAAASCDSSLLDYNTFDYELQGTWVTNQDTEAYSGTLVIDIDTIKITGYSSNPFYELTNGIKNRPFPNITKGTLLTGYSKDGKIFIEDKGLLQEGIPYTYYTGDHGNDEFLLFTFGDREEILKKVE